jgi:hypothetical protein
MGANVGFSPIADGSPRCRSPVWPKPSRRTLIAARLRPVLACVTRAAWLDALATVRARKNVRCAASRRKNLEKSFVLRSPQSRPALTACPPGLAGPSTVGFGSGAAVWPRPPTVCFYFNCGHRAAVPRTAAVGPQQTLAVQAKAPVYSMTSSAMASSDGGTERPSALAVLRLIASTKWVGCTTGRSAGFSPLRTRPV